jgi:hypothetical protein
MIDQELWDENDLLRERLSTLQSRVDELEKLYRTERDERLRLKAELIWIKQQNPTSTSLPPESLSKDLDARPSL